MSFYSYNHLDRVETGVIVFLIDCGCWCSVALPDNAVLGLQCVIVVFPNHTHLHFLIFIFINYNNYAHRSAL